MWIKREEYDHLKKMVMKHEDLCVDLYQKLEIQKDKFDRLCFEVKNPPKYEIGFQSKNFIITNRRLGSFTMSDYRVKAGKFTEYYWEYIVFDTKLKRTNVWAKETKLFTQPK